MSKKRKILIFFIFVLFIGVTIYFVIYKNIGVNNIVKNYDRSLVTCSFDKDTKIISNPFYDFNLFVSTLDKNRSYLSGEESGTRRFSFKDYFNNGVNLTEDIVFYIGRMDKASVFDTTLKASLQLCDENNKTVSTTFVSAVKSGDLKIVIYGKDPKVLPKYTGSYRVDAIISVAGQLQLVDRIGEVVFTD